MREDEAWCILARATIGPRAGMRLLEAFGGVVAAMEAPEAEWRGRARLSPAAIERLTKARSEGVAKDLGLLKRLGARAVGMNEAGYPARLKTISDPPTTLFIKGEVRDEDALAVCIVGSRRSSPYGRHVAAELAMGLARLGFTIVSGLALGIDGAAHEGALRAGGRTIAVLAGGVDVIYPPEHADLYERVAAAGAVMSEMPPGTPPAGRLFPVRNRLLSGLSLGVVVVEAPTRSGAMITASHAGAQGREVFAVPGSVNSAQSRGCHDLIRDGAKLVESVQDIVEELGGGLVPRPARTRPAPVGPTWDDEAEEGSSDGRGEVRAASVGPQGGLKSAHPKAPGGLKSAHQDAPPELAEDEAQIYAELAAGARHVDELISATGLGAAATNAALLMLELKGLVGRQPGNVFARFR